MKLMTMALAVAATMGVAHSAQARVYHHRRYGHEYRHEASGHALRRERSARWENRGWRSAGYERTMERFSERGYGPRLRERHYDRYEASRRVFRHAHWARWDNRGWRSAGYERPMERFSGGYGPRPLEWCGWEMRHLVGGDPGPSYNLARNWAHWGHAGPAGIGAIVVWPHHVGKIVGRTGGEWVIESGNDGHALRTRPRSIAGTIAIRWG